MRSSVLTKTCTDASTKMEASEPMAWDEKFTKVTLLESFEERTATNKTLTAQIQISHYEQRSDKWNPLVGNTRQRDG